MRRELSLPVTCLVTGGETTAGTNPASIEFDQILRLVESAVSAGISLVQLREKSLTARVLFQLTRRAVALTQGSETRLLVNDRADIASAAGADGVHLTAGSLEASVVRRTFGSDFVVGVSVHSLPEARAARDAGADFAIFGPVFDTPSKRAYGPPLGLERLREAASELSPFALLAIGGVARENIRDVLEAGAVGVAAIRLFGRPEELERTAKEIEHVYHSVGKLSAN